MSSTIKKATRAVGRHRLSRTTVPRRSRRPSPHAIVEIQYHGTRSYEWVLEPDDGECFDTIDHAALMDRVVAGQARP